MSGEAQGSRTGPRDPAVGPGEPVRGRSLVVRVAVVATVCLVAVVALAVNHVARENPSGPPDVVGATVVSAQLLRGGLPTDTDLLNLRRFYNVTGVVDLRVTDATEQQAVESFGMDYLLVPVPRGSAPTADDLLEMTAFLRRHSSGVVFVHDDVGGGRAITTAAMLDALHGTAEGRRGVPAHAADARLSRAQRTALQEFADALEGRPSAQNRYADAARTRW